MPVTSNRTNETSTSQTPKTDPRPRFGIGHINLGVTDVDRSAAFYSDIGMRLIVNMGRAAILELRGGTHLIVHVDEGTSSGALDLIVDDIDDTHALLVTHGAVPGAIERGKPHDRFTATDPDGNLLVVHSNHAMGPV